MIFYIQRHVVRVNTYLILRHESFILDVEHPDFNKFFTASDAIGPRTALPILPNSERRLSDRD